MSKTELFEKDVEILKRLVERFQREGWKVESAERLYALKKGFENLTISWTDGVVFCKYEQKYWNASLRREYGEDMQTDLEVNFSDIHVNFFHKKSNDKETKGVEVKKGDLVIRLPGAFYGAYTVGIFWLWTDELFEKIRFPEPFVSFFRSTHSAAKSLIEDFKIRRMPREALILNKLLWDAIVELEEGKQVGTHTYPFGERGFLSVEKAENGLRITYQHDECEFMWTIDQSGEVKKEEKIEGGESIAYAEKIDKTLTEWCQVAVRYFVELSEKIRRQARWRWLR